MFWLPGRTGPVFYIGEEARGGAAGGEDGEQPGSASRAGTRHVAPPRTHHLARITSLATPRHTTPHTTPRRAAPCRAPPRPAPPRQEELSQLEQRVEDRLQHVVTQALLPLEEVLAAHNDQLNASSTEQAVQGEKLTQLTVKLSEQGKQIEKLQAVQDKDENERRARAEAERVEREVRVFCMFSRVVVCVHAWIQMQNTISHTQEATAALGTAIQDSHSTTSTTALNLPLTYPSHPSNPAHAACPLLPPTGVRQRPRRFALRADLARPEGATRIPYTPYIRIPHTTKPLATPPHTAYIPLHLVGAR